MTDNVVVISSSKKEEWVQDPLPFEEAILSHPAYATKKHWSGLPDNWTEKQALRNITLLRESGTDTQRAIIRVGLMLTDLLLHKNRRYGNSSGDPIEVFVKGLTPKQRRAVRMDDKISRIVRGSGLKADDGEDPRIDLAGYLLLDLAEDD